MHLFVCIHRRQKASTILSRFTGKQYRAGRFFDGVISRFPKRSTRTTSVMQPARFQATASSATVVSVGQNGTQAVFSAPSATDENLGTSRTVSVAVFSSTSPGGAFSLSCLLHLLRRVMRLFFGTLPCTPYHTTRPMSPPPCALTLRLQ